MNGFIQGMEEVEGKERDSRVERKVKKRQEGETERER